MVRAGKSGARSNGKHGSEMSTREKIKEIIKAIIGLRYRELTSILFVLVIPLATAALMGLCVAIGKSVVGFIVSIFTQSEPLSFIEEFLDAFLLFFPIFSIILLITLIISTIKKKQKGKLSVAIITVISLTVSWFLGGQKLFQRYQKTMDNLLTQAVYYANGYLELGAADDAVHKYKEAVFLDKFIVLWNENTNIPRYYSGIAQAYMDSEIDLEMAKEYYEKTLSAYEKYNPNAASEIALTHLRAALTTSVLADDKATLEHSIAAASYYESHILSEDNQTSASAFLWAANAYFNDKQYENACKYFDLGIPLYYDSTEWGIGDDWNAKMIAISYYIASKAFGAVGDESKSEEYGKKYDDFVWYRDYTEDEIEALIHYFHWMNS